MRLHQRLKQIEDRARPMIKEAAIERRRSLVGRFGMCRLLCWGFTHAESLDVLADSNRRMGHGSIERLPHFTAPSIWAEFQSFLVNDPEAAQLYHRLAPYRTDGVRYSDTIESNKEQMTAIVIQLHERLEAYFMEAARADFLDYKKIHAEGHRRLAARNEQLKIKDQEGRNGA